MGYSHYFYLNPKGKKKDLSGCLDKINQVIAEHRDIIQYEEDDTKPPVVTPTLIRFNGIGEEGCETFYFEYPPDLKDKIISKEDGKVFSFCKTARKPYDIVVCKCLLILKEYLKEDMRLSSDGSFSDEEEWKPAIEQVQAMGVDILPYIIAEEI